MRYTSLLNAYSTALEYTKATPREIGDAHTIADGIWHQILIKAADKTELLKLGAEFEEKLWDEIPDIKMLVNIFVCARLYDEVLNEQPSTENK